MKIRSCRDAWLHMTDISAGRAVHNYVQLLDMQDYLVESDLFSAAILDAYSNWNLGKDITEEQKKYFSDLRGGAQGDYRAGMRAKMANVVDCLTLFPHSKRAVIAMCNESTPKHKNYSNMRNLAMNKVVVYLMLLRVYSVRPGISSPVVSQTNQKLTSYLST